MNSSITLPAAKVTEPRQAPPPGEKWCACGCGETLPAQSSFGFKRGHRKRSANPIPTLGRERTEHMDQAIMNIRREIAWREARQKEIEQEVGTNRQKVTLLRHALQSLQAIAGGGRPDAVNS